MTEYLFLGVLLFIAGFIDSLAGGGGIITLPSYLAFGLNPSLLLGTNKLSSCMGTIVSAFKFRKNIRLSRKLLIRLVWLALIFSAAGALLSRLVPPQKLKFIIFIIIPLMAYFVIKNKNAQQRESRLKTGIKKSNRAAQVIAAGVSLYDGFLGPGTGTMFAVLLNRYTGLSLLRATALAKVLNLCSNIFALCMFLVVGAVNIKLGIIMGIFNIGGNMLGVYVGKKRGAKIIRPMIILVCTLIIFKLIYDYAGVNLYNVRIKF